MEDLPFTAGIKPVTTSGGRSFSLFLQAHPCVVERVRDLTDPQDEYSTITAEDVNRFVLCERAGSGANVPKHVERKMFMFAEFFINSHNFSL